MVADHAQSRRRTVRGNLETIEVEKRNEPNNGNIVVVPEEDSRPALKFEDLIINRTKYRIPEKIIRLDFWEKIGLAK